MNLCPQSEFKQCGSQAFHSDAGAVIRRLRAGIEIALRWTVLRGQSPGLLLDSQKVLTCWSVRFPVGPTGPQGKLHKSLRDSGGSRNSGRSFFFTPCQCRGSCASVEARSCTVHLGRTRLIPNGVHIHQKCLVTDARHTQLQAENRPPQIRHEPEKYLRTGALPVHGRQRDSSKAPI